MVHFFHHHQNELLQTLPEEMRKLVDLLLDTKGADTLGLAQAAELALKLGQAARLDRKGRSMDQEAIFCTALKAARVCPDEVATFALEMAGRSNEDFTPDTEAQKAPAQEMPEPHIHTQLRPSEDPWPEGPRRPINEAFRAAVQQPMTLFHLMLQRPEVAAEVVLACFIEHRDEHTEYDFDTEIPEVVTSEHRWYPAWWARGPFSNFITHSEAQGLECIIKLVNFAAERWKERHSGFPVTVLEHQGQTKNYVGDAGVYGWSRKHVSGHRAPNDVILAALGALEQHLYTQLEKGRDITPLIEYILEHSSSVAALGVLVSVIKRQPEVLRHPTLVGLLTTWEVLVFDRVLLQERPLVLGDPRRSREITAIRAWHALPHRTLDLLDVLAEASSKDEIIQMHLTRQRETLKATDVHKTRIHTALEELTQRLNPSGNPPDQATPEGTSHGTAAGSLPLDLNTLLLFGSRCSRILDKDATLASADLEAFWTYWLRWKEKVTRIPGQLFSPLLGLAVLLQEHPTWVMGDATRKAEGLSVLLSTISPAAGQTSDIDDLFVLASWASCAARVIAHFWKENPGHPELRRAVREVVLQGSPETHITLMQEMVRHFGPEDLTFRQLRRLMVLVPLNLSALRRIKDVAETKELRTRVADETQGWLDAFVEGDFPGDLPDLRHEKDRVHRLLQGVGPSAPRHPLGVKTIWPAFAWLPDHLNREDAASFTRHVGELVDVLHFMLPPGQNYGFDGQPSGYRYPSETEMQVLHALGEVTALLHPAEDPPRLWLPLLDLGREGHDWVEAHLEGFTSEILCAAEVTDHQLLVWKQLILDTLQDHGSESNVWYGRNVLAALLGLTLPEGAWQEHHRTLVPRMSDLWKVWAPRALEDAECCAAFARWLRLPAALSLVSDGLDWIQNAAQRKHKYWWERCEQAVVQLLEALWESPQAEHWNLTTWPSFTFLLSELVKQQNAQAIALSQKAGGLRG